VTGILSGSPVHVSPTDLERVWSQHDAEISDRRRGSRESESGERRRGNERRGSA
jgi:hypothetical protein